MRELGDIREMNAIVNEDMKYMYMYDKSIWEMLKGKTVFITGAYGMLPSYMVFMLIYLNELKQESYDIQIVVLVRNEEKLRKKFGEYIDKNYFHVLIGDMSQEICYDGDIDYVVHAASPASSQYYNINPVGVLLPNVLGTYYTLELARKKGVKGYLYFSSGEIYGHVEKEIISEDDGGFLNPTDIRSCYGEGKRISETMCKCWHHQYRVPTFMVRTSHSYGPTMDLENDKRVFAEFVSNVVNNQNIAIKSDGLAIRSFCYIVDAVLGFFIILLRGEPGEAYNLANEDGRCSIRELGEMLCEMYPEKGLKVCYEQHRVDCMENAQKIHSVYSTKKLEQIGWKPCFDIRVGFERTIKSFSSK